MNGEERKRKKGREEGRKEGREEGGGSGGGREEEAFCLATEVMSGGE